MQHALLYYYLCGEFFWINLLNQIMFRSKYRFRFVSVSSQHLRFYFKLVNNLNNLVSYRIFNVPYTGKLVCLSLAFLIKVTCLYVSHVCNITFTNKTFYKYSSWICSGVFSGVKKSISRAKGSLHRGLKRLLRKPPCELSAGADPLHWRLQKW